MAICNNLNCEREVPESKARDGGLYCSGRCQKQSKLKGRKNNTSRTGSTPNKKSSNIPPRFNLIRIGASSELLVAHDLLMRGFDVFRAINPDAECDLVAVYGQKVYRVQCKTNVTATSEDHSRFDVLASVIEGKVVYPIWPADD